MPEVVVVSSDVAHCQALLDAQQLPDWQARYFATAKEARGYCATAEIFFGPPDELVQLLPHAPALRWVQSSWAGVKPLLSCPNRNYVLTGVKGIFGSLMAEYVLGWILALERNILLRASRRCWDVTPDRSLTGKTLGIMGTGSIGGHVARVCSSFGLVVRGLNSDGRPHPAFDDCFAASQRNEFAVGLDYLVALLPDTPRSDGLVDQTLLSALQPGAIFINGGRANCVRDADLVAALANGQLRAAVLDVMREEPLPADNALWSVANLYITSHTAALTQTEPVVALFADNYRRFCQGRELQYRVDFERGY